MFDRRRRLVAALLVLPVWVSVLAVSLVGAPPANAGSATTPTSCTNTAQAGTTALNVTLSGDAQPSSVAVDDTVTLEGATFGIDVPGTVLLAGYGLGLLTAGVNNIPADVNVQLLGLNTTEGSQDVGPISVIGTTTITDPTPANKTSGDESATPLAVSATLPTTTWTAAGGDIGISLGTSSTTALVGPGGIIAVAFSCTPGTPAPAGCGPAPLTQCTSTAPVPAAPFTSVTVAGGTTSTTGSTSSTTSSSSTTTPTSSSSTTASTLPSTTSTTEPPVVPTIVSGTGRYVATCSNNATPDSSELSFAVTGSTLSPVEAGSSVSLVDQSWAVTVPASVLQTGINLGLLKPGDSPAGQAVVSVFASNTKEGLVESAPIALTVGPILVSGGLAQPAATTFAVPDMSWTAVGGDVSFAMAGAEVAVKVGPLEVVFTCEPKDAGTTIVTAAVRGTTDIPPAGSEVLGETVVPSPGSQSLPRTGSNPVVPLVLALGLIDIGYLLASAARPARRRLRHLVQ